jgi:hypothetical protein
MRGIWFGVVSIREGNTQANRFYSLLAESEREAVTKMLEDARGLLPDGEVVNRVAYRIDDTLVRQRAAELG